MLQNLSSTEKIQKSFLLLEMETEENLKERLKNINENLIANQTRMKKTTELTHFDSLNLLV